MLKKLRQAIRFKPTQKAREEALADAMSDLGIVGDFTTTRLGTVYATDHGTFTLRGTTLTRKNPAPPKKITKADADKAAKSKRTESGQLNAVVAYLAAHGVTTSPTIEEASERGRVLRFYMWETDIGTLVLKAGPAWVPQVQVVTADQWSDAPKGAYVPAHPAKRSKKATERTRRAASRAAAPKPAKKPARKPAKKTAPKRAARKPAAPKRAARKPAAPKRAPKKAAPKRAPKRAPKKAGPKRPTKAQTAKAKQEAADARMLAIIQRAIESTPVN